MSLHHFPTAKLLLFAVCLRLQLRCTDKTSFAFVRSSDSRWIGKCSRQLSCIGQWRDSVGSTKLRRSAPRPSLVLSCLSDAPLRLPRQLLPSTSARPQVLAPTWHQARELRSQAQIRGHVIRRGSASQHQGTRAALPIDPLLPDVVRTLEDHGALVLQAPPGAGKTTRVPLALAEASWLSGKKILVLEPRRLAAVTAARRMASEIGDEVGQKVGYSVRLDKKVSAHTQVEVLTYGLFLRRLVQDPDLTGVGCVIFDEFHERGVDSDISLAFVLEVRDMLPEVAVVVMSATLAAEQTAMLMGDVPLLHSEGRTFPVEVRYAPPSFTEELPGHVERVLLQALLETAGDVLVFLPGQGEIRSVQRTLETAPLPPGVKVTPLYGDLSLAEQEVAIKPAPQGSRKVVLATAIAESSLTIEGVTVVIDSGLARLSRFDARRGMNELVTEPASQASAEQRCGRAGRLRPGLCIRLWSNASHGDRPNFDSPELARCDMAPIALTLASWGTTDPADLRLLIPIDSELFSQGRELLRSMGAIDDRNVSTTHGEALASLGVHPRLAHMMLRAKEQDLGTLGARLAVLLSERDPLNRMEAGSDLVLRLQWLQELGGNVRLRERYLSLSLELGRQAGIATHRQPLSNTELSSVGELVALAYPDRVALPVDDSYVMASGRSAKLSKGDPMCSHSALAIAEADSNSDTLHARILTAARLTPQRIRDCFEDRLEIHQSARWDKSTNKVKTIEEVRFGALVLERRPSSEADAAETRRVLIKKLQEQHLRPLPWKPASRSLRERLEKLHTFRPEQWPDRSEEWLETNLEEWLGDQLDGISSFAELAALQLEEGLWQGMPYNQRAELERLLPSTWRLPSGRTVKIDYSGPEPVVAAKLQEFFGCRETPRVMDNTVPMLVHLLSPAGRPLQITRDLAGFWEGSYVEVRKDARGRYPKHPWPEDPYSVLPTAKSNRALRKEQEAKR